MTEHRTLRKLVTEIVRKYEAGQNHDEGAFDPNCDICLILDELRRALGEEQKR